MQEQLCVCRVRLIPRAREKGICKDPSCPYREPPQVELLRRQWWSGRTQSKEIGKLVVYVR